MGKPHLTLLCCLMLLISSGSQGQELSQYDRFQLDGGELYWQNDYAYDGNADSMRLEVEQMLKSRAFTFQVIRSQEGFSGKINHYQVNPKQYGRTYLNTPKMYWDGEWSGQFVVELGEGHYTVMVYALRFKSETQSVGHYKPEKIRTGPYIDVVTTNNRQSLLRSEFPNLSLMSVSLKDNFDLKYNKIPGEGQ
jgi:hypothetical protein